MAEIVKMRNLIKTEEETAIVFDDKVRKLESRIKTLTQEKDLAEEFLNNCRNKVVIISYRR